MSIPNALTQLAGEWTGAKQLWLNPTDPGRQCAATASVGTAAQGQFLTIRYTWAVDDQPQDGLLLLGSETPDALPTAVWIDSWHMAHQFMLCAGESVGENRAAVRGAYAAPPGPDWGWRIAVEADGAAQFRLIMHIITPDGDEALAVLASFARQTETSRR
jgi:hypothetical protein